MFGSLVIVFPTTHTGGALHLRHNGEEFVHDSGKENLSPDQVSWATFFSDVEHEVKPVESGHRVTVTYNLHFCGDTAPSSPPAMSQEPIVKALKAMLDDQTALPNGGYLGFGLAHQYPIQENGKSLTNLKKFFKGRDAALFNGCKSLGLDAQLKIIYETSDGDQVYMTDRFVNLDGEIEDMAEIFDRADGVCIQDKGRYNPKVPDLTVDWISPPNRKTCVQSTYIAYGNEASLDSIYGDVNLVVQIGSSDDRMLQTPKNVAPKKKRRYGYY